MHISSKLLLSIAPVLLVTGCRSKEKGKTAVAHPNILLVINDDQSFAHTSFSGSKFVHTPGFDRIAVNGVYFMNCYAGSPGSAARPASSKSARCSHICGWYAPLPGQIASWPHGTAASRSRFAEPSLSPFPSFVVRTQSPARSGSAQPDKLL